jgi:uncharacterized membrane protein YfcA
MNIMSVEIIILITLAIGVVAFLYSSVGHAGASGYIAVMSLFSMAPAEIKPIALSLNIIVASIGFWQFYRGGHFSWKFTWPFLLLSIPAAFLGGYLDLPTTLFKMVLGFILIGSAIRFLIPVQEPESIRPVSDPTKVATGAGIGFMAGLTGTGGGIFLTPTSLHMRWASVKATAATSVLFILVNSSAGLAGNYTSTLSLPAIILPMIAAVIVGGYAGSSLGSGSFNDKTIKRILSVVLFIAGLKLILA